MDGSEAAMGGNDRYLCKADYGTAEAKIEYDSLMADSKATVGGSASLLRHVAECMSSRMQWIRPLRLVKKLIDKLVDGAPRRLMQ